jgi:hypothetical protein
MNQPRPVLTVILACCIHCIAAQSISPSVISTAGGLASSESGSLSYTIGEMAMIETFSTKANVLTQGFQQPWDFITAIDDPASSIGIAVYPNPASGFFYVHLQSTLYAEAQLTVTNVLGSQIFHELVDISTGSVVHRINTAHLPAGIYVLAVKGLNQQGKDVRPVSTKIHIAN